MVQLAREMQQLTAHLDRTEVELQAKTVRVSGAKCEVLRLS